MPSPDWVGGVVPIKIIGGINRLFNFGVELPAMPTIFIEGYKFRFYSSDIHEPPHVHIIRGDSVAKIWLVPVSVEYNRGYNQPELNRIVRLALKNQEKLLEVWNDHFNQ